MVVGFLLYPRVYEPLGAYGENFIFVHFSSRLEPIPEAWLLLPSQKLRDSRGRSRNLLLTSIYIDGSKKKNLDLK